MGKFGRSKWFRVLQEEVEDPSCPPKTKLIYWVFDRRTNQKIGEPFDEERAAEEECRLQNDLTP